MTEALKNLYTRSLIDDLCLSISPWYKNFDGQSFSRQVFDRDWKDRELKQRMRHITFCLNSHLPADYRKTISILKPVSAKYQGFEYMFFQDYVECYGLDDFDTSIDAMEHFTKFASAEFAVRAFILQDQARMMEQMNAWALSDNHHVRRLASEGCRPRLPWAISLPAFKKEPKPVLRVIKKLMFDDSEYVRRSVANNLNDISKDNPHLVIDWAKRYLGKDRNTERLIKHACRTLLKQGDQTTLSLFGFTDPSHLHISQFTLEPRVRFGNRLPFTFSLSCKNNNTSSIGMCRLEFAIDFVKANGSLSRKVFKISEGDYAGAEKQVSRYFSFKDISTRKYYTGKHQLTIIINGVQMATETFELTN